MQNQFDTIHKHNKLSSSSIYSAQLQKVFNLRGFLQVLFMLVMISLVGCAEPENGPDSNTLFNLLNDATPIELSLNMAYWNEASNSLSLEGGYKNARNFYNDQEIDVELFDNNNPHDALATFTVMVTNQKWQAEGIELNWVPCSIRARVADREATKEVEDAPGNCCVQTPSPTPIPIPDPAPSPSPTPAPAPAPVLPPSPVYDYYLNSVSSEDSDEDSDNDSDDDSETGEDSDDDSDDDSETDEDSDSDSDDHNRPEDHHCGHH